MTCCCFNIIKLHLTDLDVQRCKHKSNTRDLFTAVALHLVDFIEMRTVYLLHNDIMTILNISVAYILTSNILHIRCFHFDIIILINNNNNFPAQLQDNQNQTKVIFLFCNFASTAFKENLRDTKSVLYIYRNLNIINNFLMGIVSSRFNQIASTCMTDFIFISEP